MKSIAVPDAASTPPSGFPQPKIPPLRRLLVGCFLLADCRKTQEPRTDRWIFLEILGIAGTNSWSERFSTGTAQFWIARRWLRQLVPGSAPPPRIFPQGIGSGRDAPGGRNAASGSRTETGSVRATSSLGPTANRDGAPRVVQPGTLSRANRPIAGGPVADNVLAQDGVMGRRQGTSLAGLAA